MRVLCCGDRNWTSYEIIRRELEKLQPDTFIIEGCAIGADRISGNLALEMGYRLLEFSPNWDKYGNIVDCDSYDEEMK